MRARPATPQKFSDGEDRLVDRHSPEVPLASRTKVLALAQPGNQLWCCPHRSAPRRLLGLMGVGPRDAVIEWWLLDAQRGLSRRSGTFERAQSVF
jgi:hypothetical protein